MGSRHRFLLENDRFDPGHPLDLWARRHYVGDSVRHRSNPVRVNFRKFLEGRTPRSPIKPTFESREFSGNQDLWQIVKHQHETKGKSV